MLQNTALDTGLVIAEGIRNNVMNDQIDIEGVNQSLTVSLGVGAQIPVNGFNPDSLLKEADHMLFKSKRNGRNKVTPVFHHS